MKHTAPNSYFLIALQIWLLFNSSAYRDERRMAVQASLVIRDLTLRVFAITRFRGKKAV